MHQLFLAITSVSRTIRFVLQILIALSAVFCNNSDFLPISISFAKNFAATVLSRNFCCCLPAKQYPSHSQAQDYLELPELYRKTRRYSNKRTGASRRDDGRCLWPYPAAAAPGEGPTEKMTESERLGLAADICRRVQSPPRPNHHKSFL